MRPLKRSRWLRPHREAARPDLHIPISDTPATPGSTPGKPDGSSTPAGAETSALKILVRHLRELEKSVSGMELEDSRWLTEDDQPADREKGLLVRYRTGGELAEGQGEARLWISGRRAKLKARWEDDHGMSDLQERFNLTLGDRPRWGDRVFPSLADLATALVGLMRVRLQDLSSVPYRPESRLTRWIESLEAGDRF